MTLFDLEINYQKLYKQIKSPSTKSFKLKIISQFLISLTKESCQKKYFSYYYDLVPILIDSITSNELMYYSPEEIKEIIELLSFIENNIPFENLQLRFEESKTILENSQKKILKILENKSNYKTALLNPKSLAIILLEKRDENFANYNVQNGLICNLSIELLNRLKQEVSDKVEFKNLFEINGNEILEHLLLAVSRAKEECKSKSIKTHTYYCTFQFDKQGCIYTGSSLGLGAICLAYNSILMNELNKHYFMFRGDCAFTGEIDLYGNLKKLDEESLKVKLKTVFFSEYKTFVIPEKNFSEIKKELAKLNEKYPNRKLKLIPIKNFMEVFDISTIVERYKLKVLQKSKLIYKKHQTAANWILSLLSVVIICFFAFNYLIPRLDSNPVTKLYENDKYTIYNKYGVKIWESDLMDKTNKSLFSDKFDFDRRITLSDINNDGKNEILYIARSDTGFFQNRSVYCYNSDNTIKWIYTKSQRQVFYNSGLCPDLFQTYGLYVFENKINNQKYIFCTGNLNEEFPFCITKLDFNGKLISEYWHSGHLPHIKFYDIDKSQNIVLVAAYCNNIYKRASLLIFNPDFVDGASPETDPLKNGKKGVEKYYILFPRTIINYYSGRDINNVVNIDQYNGEGLNVTVCESMMKREGENDFIIYKFDRNMKIIDVIFSSPWIGNYETLVLKKLIEPFKNLKSYADSLKNAVQYWDGDKFVNYPIINKHFLTASGIYK